MRRPLMGMLPGGKRLTWRAVRYLLLSVALWCFICFFLFGGSGRSWLDLPTASIVPPAPRMPSAPILETLQPRVDCYGARGKLLSTNSDDQLRYGGADIPYPTPFSGSHRDLGSDLTWMTADGRYGPYGFGEEKTSYRREKVDWNGVDWGKLQDDCLARNQHRFPSTLPSTRVGDGVRFSLFNRTTLSPAPQWNEFNNTRRTALIIRTYGGYEYKTEDLWSIRALITEAALNTGGEYVVVLLVNIHEREMDIFDSPENYQRAMTRAKIPPELQSIAVLWDDNLLEGWYKAVQEHRTMWQANQPLQLFALHYPEFDHYWQLEMDQRFLGEAGRYLDAVSAFARREPRKQAFERATFSFSEQESGSYANFSRDVDAANAGRSRAWGPVTIPDVAPIGPEPPSASPGDDDFRWGVGEDADVLLSGFCEDVRKANWVFRDYIQGFRHGTRTPRWWCPPAIMRGSRALLLSVHVAQHTRGLSLPSESILPTFALWHGLKLSYPPQPAYMRARPPGREPQDETSRDRSEWRHPRRKPWFGWAPGESADGLGHPDPQSFADRGNTWWWASEYPRRVMDVWLGGETHAADMPGMLAVHDGTVFAPNFAMHPVKTA